MAISSPNPTPQLTLHECDDLQAEEIWKPHDSSLAGEPEDSNP